MPLTQLFMASAGPGGVFLAVLWGGHCCPPFAQEGTQTRGSWCAQGCGADEHVAQDWRLSARTPERCYVTLLGSGTGGPCHTLSQPDSSSRVGLEQVTLQHHFDLCFQRSGQWKLLIHLCISDRKEAVSEVLYLTA